MSAFYTKVAQPFGWAAFRIVVGGLLMVEGWPKIMAPFAQGEFVESLGFFPGWLFSPLLALLQFVGGFMLIIGLLTRPIALANAVMLLVTLWFHAANPYGEVLLSAEGVAFLANNLQFLSEEGRLHLLPDGGASFLHQVQAKAVFNSGLWTAGAALIATFGGGALSVDRLVVEKEF